MMVSRLNASSETLAEIDDAIGRIDAGQFNVWSAGGRSGSVVLPSSLGRVCA